VIGDPTVYQYGTDAYSDPNTFSGGLDTVSAPSDLSPINVNTSVPELPPLGTPEGTPEDEWPGAGASTTQYGTDAYNDPNTSSGRDYFSQLDRMESDSNRFGDEWAAGGGYLSSSGILAPYHKKLIDGLYAGGRINY
jgi:hypothetical protein